MSNAADRKTTSDAPHGWVDLQVNGYDGVDFSGPGLNLDKIGHVVRCLADRGVTAFCPTMITSPEEIYRENLPLLAEAAADDQLGPHLLGIHLEGPFLSPLDGARGAHPRESVREPSIPFLQHLLEWADDWVSLVTLAPEMPGAIPLIDFLASRGVLVSLGHHLANQETICRACDAGATLATHLGNGIPNQLPRHPNPIWDQLAEERLKIMLIADGHHLPDSFLKVCWRAAGADRILLTSDAAPIAGYPAGEYMNLGHKVRLEENGKLWNPAGNHLVGSSFQLDQCVRHAERVLGLTGAESRKIARENALSLLGLT